MLKTLQRARHQAQAAQMAGGQVTLVCVTHLSLAVHYLCKVTAAASPSPDVSFLVTAKDGMKTVSVDNKYKSGNLKAPASGSSPKLENFLNKLKILSPTPRVCVRDTRDRCKHYEKFPCMHKPVPQSAAQRGLAGQ